MYSYFLRYSETIFDKNGKNELIPFRLVNQKWKADLDNFESLYPQYFFLKNVWSLIAILCMLFFFLSVFSY